MRKQIFPKTALLLAVLILSSCASLQRQVSANLPAFRDSSHHGKDDEGFEYMLGPDDGIRVVVQQHPEWSGEYTVRPDGKIFIPSVGEVAVEGLIGEGAEVAIAARLEEYIENPKVVVDVVRYASQSIYVLGQVNRPGKYSTEGKNITVRDAIILAGLPAPFAAIGRVYVITPSRGRPAQKVINLHRILYRGEMQRNIRLKPGDIVYVPRTVWGEISELFSVILSPLSTTVPAARAAMTPIP